MARSLILKSTCTTEEISSVTFEKDIYVIKIEVIVDGQSGNGSFTVGLSNDYWFTCTAEREGGHTYLVIRANENSSTLTRYGTVSVMHNCADITKNLSIVQSGASYSVGFTELPDCLKFKRMPDKNQYEEKELTVASSGGSGKWHVKDIQQKYVFDIETPDNKKETVRKTVPYNGCFEHRIDGDKLIVRSYGDIELEMGDEKRHIEYDLTIIHDDISNSKMQYVSQEDNNYEATVTFSFDGADGERY